MRPGLATAAGPAHLLLAGSHSGTFHGWKSLGETHWWPPPHAVAPNPAAAHSQKSRLPLEDQPHCRAWPGSTWAQNPAPNEAYTRKPHQERCSKAPGPGENHRHRSTQLHSRSRHQGSGAGVSNPLPGPERYPASGGCPSRGPFPSKAGDRQSGLRVIFPKLRSPTCLFHSREPWWSRVSGGEHCWPRGGRTQMPMPCQGPRLHRSEEQPSVGVFLEKGMRTLVLRLPTSPRPHCPFLTRSPQVPLVPHKSLRPSLICSFLSCSKAEGSPRGHLKHCPLICRPFL